MFKLSRTFANPTKGQNAGRGFPSPGEGAQTTGDYTPPPGGVSWTPERPTKGRRSFFVQKPGSQQRGFPSPTNRAQRRPEGSMDAVAVQYGYSIPTTRGRSDMGARGVVQNFGKVLTNPIGAGVVALHRPQASYGGAAQYVAGWDFWSSQSIPTTVNLQGLTRPEVLEAVLSQIEVQGVVRVG